LRTFFGKRVARLAPVYYFSLLIALAPFVLYHSATEIGVSTVATLLCMQSLT
jgi:hypothetical protein